MPDDVRADIERELEQRASDRADRATPEAAAERRRSQTAYAGLSGADAVSLAKSRFPGFFRSPLWHAPRLAAGERIRRYTSDSSYLIDRPSGRDLLAVSSAPLLTSDATGEKAPIDTDLEQSGGSLRPANTSADARIADDAGGSSALTHAGVKFHVVGADPGVSATVVDDKAVFPNAVQDSDVTVAAVDSGLEVLLQLRSQDSPEDQALDFDLPEGAQLRLSYGQDNGIPHPNEIGAEIVKDGEAIATIPPPAAADADGQPVPASYSVDGNRLTIHTPHRGGDWRYPILVDPFVVDDFQWRDQADFLNDAVSAGWRYGPSGGGWTFYNCSQLASCNTGTGLSGRGMYVQTAAGTYPGDYSALGVWYLQALKGSNIVNARFYQYGMTAGGTTCTYGFITTGSGHQGNTLYDCNPHTALTNAAPVCTASPDCSSTAGSTAGNYVEFGHIVFGHLTAPSWSYLGRVDLSLWEGNRPRVLGLYTSSGATQLFAPPTGWVDHYAPGFNAKVHDDGLGVASASFTVDGANLGTFGACFGNHGHPCPNDIVMPAFSYNTDNLAEGIHTGKVTTTDIIGNSSDPDQSSSFGIKVDRSPPVLSPLSGPLASLDGQVTAGSSYDLTAAASDPYSGVRDLRVYLNGAEQGTSPTCATDGCSLNRTTTIPLKWGSNTITVRAWDKLGHEATQRTLTVSRDRVAPTVTKSGTLWDGRTGWLGTGTYGLHVDARDGDAANPDSGIANVELLIDGQRAGYSSQSCATDSCPLVTDLQVDATHYSGGTHTVTLKTTDQGGRTDTSTWSVQIDPAVPTLTGSGTLTANDGAWTNEGTYGLTLDATDAGGSAAKAPTLERDGQPVTPATSSCTTGCSATYNFDAATLPEGMHTFVARATDNAGNATTKQWTLGVDRTAPSVDLSGTMRDDMATQLPSGSYDLDASATDYSALGSTSGTRSVEIMIDGKRVNYAEQPCLFGGCALFRTIDYRPEDYGPGDHGVRVVARDYAGNEAATEWTEKGQLTTSCEQSATSTAPIGDVDPGHAPITTGDATSSVAAVQPELVDHDSAAITGSGTDPGDPGSTGGATGDPDPAPAPEPGLQQQPDGALVSTGTEATSRVDENPRNGFSTAMAGTTICARPEAVDPTGTEADKVADNALVNANTADGADTVVKPTPTGVETFTSIREADAPEDFTWKIDSPGNELRPAENGGVSVIDPNAHYTAADAGPKPADTTVDSDQIPDLVNSDELPADTVAPDPGAASQAEAAVSDIAPSTDEPPTDVVQTLVDGPAPQKPEDAPVAADDADLADQGATAQENVRASASGQLQADRSVAATDSAGVQTAAQQSDQVTLSRPVEVGEVTPPLATDATGLGVQSSLTVSGDEVTLNVDHKQPNVTYPVVADPWVQAKHSKPVWTCCRAVYRYETRVDHYDTQLKLVSWTHGSDLFRYPHTLVGNNVYSVRTGTLLGTVLMINQAWSPVYMVLRVPVFKTVPVYDHSEPYITFEEEDVPEWQDDPYPRLSDPKNADTTPYDPKAEQLWPLGPPSASCTVDTDPAARDNSFCGDSTASNPTLAAAEAEPPAASRTQTQLNLPAGFPAGCRQHPMDSPRWGISEQQPDTFADPRLTTPPNGQPAAGTLDLKRARLITSYDYWPLTKSRPASLHGSPVTDDDWLALQGARYQTDRWLQVAEQQCIEPLVSFGPGKLSPGHLPSLGEYSEGVLDFMNSHPEVKYFTAWNEPNNAGAGGPTATNPRRAGEYYRRLASICAQPDRHCVVAAGDFSDKKLTPAWFNEYMIGAGAPGTTPILAYHPYGQLANPDSVKDKFNLFMKMASGFGANVWLTESGGRVVPSWIVGWYKAPSSETKATEQASKILDLATNSPYADRIKRFYYYQWVGDAAFPRDRKAAPSSAPWDSGLVKWGTDYGAPPQAPGKWKARAQLTMFRAKVLGP